MIGGDLKVANYRYRARNENSDFVLFPSNPSVKPISMFSSVMLLCKIGIATDPLFIHATLFNCGLLEGLIIFCFIMLLIQLSTILYTCCWFYGIAYNYPDIWECVVGSRSTQFVPIILIILAYLSFVVYHGYEVFEDFQSFLATVAPNTPSFLANKYLITYVLCFLCGFPAFFVKDFTSLVWVAILGNLSMGVHIICLLVSLIRAGKNFGFQITVQTIADGEVDDYGFSPFTTFFSKDITGLFLGIGDIMTAFFTQPMLDLTFQNMANPTISRCLKCTWITSFCSLFVHYLTSVISYFLVQFHYNSYLTNSYGRHFNLFLSDMQNEKILFNFPFSHPEAVIGQIASYIETLTSLCIYTYFIASQVSLLFIDKNQITPLTNAISGFVVILFYIGMNFIPSSATEIFDMMAVGAFIVLVFLLPGVFYLKLFKFRRPFWSCMSILLLVIGIPMSALVLNYSGKDYTESY